MVGQGLRDRTALPLVGVLLAVVTLIAVAALQPSNALAANSVEPSSTELVVPLANTSGLAVDELNQPRNPSHTYYNSRVVCGWEWRTTTSTIIGADGQPHTITVTYRVWRCSRIWYPVDHTHTIEVDPD